MAGTRTKGISHARDVERPRDACGDADGRWSRRRGDRRVRGTARHRVRAITGRLVRPLVRAVRPAPQRPLRESWEPSAMRTAPSSALTGRAENRPLTHHPTKGGEEQIAVANCDRRDCACSNCNKAGTQEMRVIATTMTTAATSAAASSSASGDTSESNWCGVAGCTSVRLELPRVLQVPREDRRRLRLRRSEQ